VSLQCAVGLVAASACPSTCYEGTCDYWDGGYWGTCSTLARRFGCDCGGCECDGCPQGKCEEAPFNPQSCPMSGNGMCDESDNIEECAWDGGDCCKETCIGTLCGSQGYACRKPNAAIMANESEDLQSQSDVRPQNQQQQEDEEEEDAPQFHGEVTFQVQMGEASADWTLFGSLAKDALASTFSYTSINILTMDTVPFRRLSADKALPKTRVAIRFSARAGKTAHNLADLSDADLGSLQSVMQGLLVESDSDIVMISTEARECQDASCESSGGSGDSGADSDLLRTEEESSKAAGPSPAVFGVIAGLAAVLIALIVVTALVMWRHRPARNTPPAVGDASSPKAESPEKEEDLDAEPGLGQAGKLDSDVPQVDSKPLNMDTASNSTADHSNEIEDIEAAEDEQ